MSDEIIQICQIKDSILCCLLLPFMDKRGEINTYRLDYVSRLAIAQQTQSYHGYGVIHIGMPLVTPVSNVVLQW